MNVRIVLAVAAAALLAACGADESSCTSRDAELAENAITPDRCSAQAGSTVTIPVNLCPRCSDTRASCQAEFRNGQIEIAPIFFECEEDRGCPIIAACENSEARRANCTVAIPLGTPPGPYDIVNAGTGGERVGDLEVSLGAPSCAFASTEGI
jgi:hypothetical protein